MSLTTIAIAAAIDETVTAEVKVDGGNVSVDIRPLRTLAGWGVTVEWDRRTGEYLIGEHHDDRKVRVTWSDDSEGALREVRRIIAANTPA